MITPDIVIAACVKKLNDNKVSLGLLDNSIELSEDSDSIDLRPPYAVVFENFNDDAQVDESGNPYKIPTSIIVGISSASHKTVAESSAEAYKIGIKVLKLITGHYRLKNIDDEDESVFIKPQPVPIRVGNKSAAQTGVLVYFNYNINIAD